MAQDFKINVSNAFSMKALSDYVVQKTAEKGYFSTVSEQGDTTVIKVEKNTDGIYMIIGMVESVNVKLRVDDGCLSVNFTDVEYVSKIIAFAIGWFFLWVLWIPAIIGLVNQSNLNKDIATHIRNFVQTNTAPEQVAEKPQQVVASARPVNTENVVEAEAQLVNTENVVEPEGADTAKQ